MTPPSSNLLRLASAQSYSRDLLDCDFVLAADA